MAGIRPLRSSDMEQVTRLVGDAFPLGSTSRDVDLRASLTRLFLDNPWFDPEIPSLVLEGADGRLLGFIGSAVRRMRLDGRPVRMACSSSLATSPAGRTKGVGALLLRRFLGGQQDLTMTDSAGAATEKLWTRLGGFSVPIASIAWIRPLRPLGLAATVLLRRLGREELGTHLRRRLAMARPHPTRFSLAKLAVEPVGVTLEPWRPRDVVARLEEIAEPHRLVPDYDEPFLEWIMREVDEVKSRGGAVAAMVRRGEQTLGWYVFLIHPSGLGQEVQLIARDVHAATVRRQLLFHAQELGASAVYGRLDAQHVRANVVDPRTLLRPGLRFLVHTHDDHVASAIRSGDAALSGLEGDGWMHR